MKEAILDIIQESSELYDYYTYKAEGKLADAITLVTMETGDNIYMTEKSKETIGTEIKKFFADIIIALKKLIDKLTTETTSLVRSATFKVKMMNLKKELEEKGSLSLVKVKDVWTLTECYQNAVDDLLKFSRKMSKMNYHSVKEIDRDIDAFDNIYNKHMNILDKAYEKEVIINSKTMLTFVEDELSGRGTVLKLLNESMKQLEQMEKECDRLILKSDILGSDIVQKRVGLLRRVGTRIHAATKKWSVRLISSMVFIFA